MLGESQTPRYTWKIIYSQIKLLIEWGIAMVESISKLLKKTGADWHDSKKIIRSSFDKHQVFYSVWTAITKYQRLDSL